MFWLSGCAFFYRGPLGCTNALKQTIHIEPQTIPIKTRLNQLSGSQKWELDRQVTNLLEEGIIVESNSPWNSTIQVVSKRFGLDGEQKWLLVVDFESLNEKKRSGMPWPYRNTWSNRAVQLFYIAGHGDGITSDWVRGRVRAQYSLEHQTGTVGI